MSSFVSLAVFLILLYYCDFLRHITKYYDILRQITSYYDILRHLRHITTYHDILRHLTTYYAILRQITCFTVEKHFLSKISSFKRIYSQTCRNMLIFRFCSATEIGTLWFFVFFHRFLFSFFPFTFSFLCCFWFNILQRNCLITFYKLIRRMSCLFRDEFICLFWFRWMWWCYRIWINFRFSRVFNRMPFLAVKKVFCSCDKLFLWWIISILVFCVLYFNFIMLHRRSLCLC